MISKFMISYILRKATNCAFLILAMSSENDRGTCLVGLLLQMTTIGPL